MEILDLAGGINNIEQNSKIYPGSNVHEMKYDPKISVLNNGLYGQSSGLLCERNEEREYQVIFRELALGSIVRHT